MVAKPHGGKLVNKVSREPRRSRLLEEARELYQISLDLDTAVDVENIAHGVYSPLEGFMVQDDYLHVLEGMRLSDDTPWTMPLILDLDPRKMRGISEGDDVTLAFRGSPLAILHVEEIYEWDKKRHVRRIYGTTDPAHPGIAQVMQRRELLIGGPIELLSNVPISPNFERYLLWPAETRVLFEEKGWRRIAGFQTRNVPHMGHEYIQKAALTFVDGLFINPLIGKKKPGDWRDEVILEAYEALIRYYYPRDVTVLAILRTRMRYAGPREAVHHAIIRKNFGCTHFIIGRDHAGVDNYYGPYDAWQIFQEFPDLGITPLFIREAFYCRKCNGMVNEKICPHDEQYRIRISGTRIREMIKKGEIPPSELMRPEVAKAILRFKELFVR